MKKFLPPLCVALALTATPYATHAETIVDATTVKDYGCGGHRQESASRAYYEDSEMSWEIEYNDGILSVTWLNFITNCCPEEIRSWFVREDNDIVLHLAETFGWCNCICSYDVTSTFGEIEPGHYTISFYGTDVTREIDIEEGCAIVIKAPGACINNLAITELMHITPDSILHIDTSGTFTVEIYDDAGILRARLDSEGACEIDLTVLSKGIYTARLSSGTKESTLRFVR